MFYFTLLFTFQQFATNLLLADQPETLQSLAQPGKEPIATQWWNETRHRLEITALRSSSARRTVVRLLSDPEVLLLVFEPYLDLEPRLAVQCALNKLLAN